LVLLLAVPVSTVSSQALAATAPPVVDGGFCADRPSALDSRIATAVNALGVSPLTTAPIAVLDTGISDDAPELAGRLVSPFDATSGGNDASDVSGHGTEVAAIAAGAPGLVQGVSSMSPVMPVRVFNRSGDSTPQWLVRRNHGCVQQGRYRRRVCGKRRERGGRDPGVAPPRRNGRCQ
jgi:subtilisin family serine protease